ncbi:MAG: DUF192 domain-containing protein [Phycisphaerales bacterium]|nr:MAG: DUF192 domain-containing protein [Phycisphaerales bacterium]
MSARRTWRTCLTAAALGLTAGGSCSPSKSNPLDDMTTARITIGEHAFEVWVAADDATREKGLMFVPAEQLADLSDGAHRGMIFVFETERLLSFWMKNTITALDIAFIDADGIIVKQHTMKPLDLGSYPSERPARFALEVRANLFAELGIKTGDHVEIPPSVLKTEE